MTRPLTEETKQRIAELYQNTDLSPGTIASALGVSVRTVRRYEDYSGLGRPRLDSNRKARPDNAQASPDGQASQAIDEIERSSPNKADQALEAHEEPETLEFVGGTPHKPVEPEIKEPEEEEFEHECERCGHKFKGVLKSCPNCSLEFDMESYEGSEEKDEYQCYNCGHIQGTKFTDCPKCGTTNDF